MAGIIKSGHLHENVAPAQIAQFNFEDMSSKADTYLEAIRRQAAQILTQAKQQAGAIEAQAKQQGKQEALKEVERYSQTQVEQQMQSLLPALQKVVESIQQARDAWIKRWETQTVELALAIARSIVRRELTAAPDISLEFIRESLELVTGQGRLTLHLAPADVDALGPQAQQLIERICKTAECRIVANPEIELGGCRVESEFGSVDQQLSNQLQRIREELLDDHA